MSNLSKETYARRRLILKWRRFLGLCSNCGAEAYGNSKCDRCQDRATERQKALRAKRKEKNLCRSCGKVEVKAGQWRCDACAIKKYGAKTCCTDGCNNAVLRGKRLCDECIELREAERQVCNVYFIACPDCNKLFTAKHRGHLRCDACQAIRTHRLNTEHRIERDGLTLHKKICVCCGEEFTTYKSNQKTCNPLCSKRMTKRNENHRRRAARYGRKHIEKVNIATLFYRDNRRCQLCSKKLNLKRKVPHPLAATTDHIIALAEGGEHSYKNTQLACFMCNSIKGSGSWPGGEQLRMFG